MHMYIRSVHTTTFVVYIQLHMYIHTHYIYVCRYYAGFNVLVLQAIPILGASDYIHTLPYVPGGGFSVLDLQRTYMHAHIHAPLSYAWLQVHQVGSQHFLYGAVEVTHCH